MVKHTHIPHRTVQTRTPKREIDWVLVHRIVVGVMFAVALAQRLGWLPG